MPLTADVLILGEVHDNPEHHANQAALVGAMNPAALVFEMLTPAQAALAEGSELETDALARLLEWESSGWPDFGMYHPILLAAPEARVYGAAVPRADLRGAMRQGAAAMLGDQAATLGVTPRLPEAEQTLRETLQAQSHCNALPADLLPGMVEAQRLRDARFAASVLTALDETGGPVAVITGNGHARTDWGIPANLRAARPDLTVLALGQFEGGPGDLPVDLWLVTGTVDRDDPCAAFR